LLRTPGWVGRVHGDQATRARRQPATHRNRQDYSAHIRPILPDRAAPPWRASTIARVCASSFEIGFYPRVVAQPHRVRRLLDSIRSPREE
jgi:hypothetical protein